MCFSLFVPVDFSYYLLSFPIQLCSHLPSSGLYFFFYVILHFFVQLLFKTVKRRKEGNYAIILSLYVPIELPLLALFVFLCGVKILFWVTFFQSEELSLGISCKANLLATNFLSFCLSGNVFIMPLF